MRDWVLSKEPGKSVIHTKVQECATVHPVRASENTMEQVWEVIVWKLGGGIPTL